MKYLIILILAIFAQGVFARCQHDPQIVRADYQVRFYKDDKLVRQNTIILWRQQDTVAHQYPQTHITESWHLLKNQLIKPSRFFDSYQRAIEYQPGVKVHGKSESDWSYRYQLVSDTLISQLTLTSENNIGCQRQQVFSKQTPKGNIELSWLPSLQLLNHFSWDNGEVREEWELLTKVHNANEVVAFFEQLQKYQSTDYADIGDDHSDPFLNKMLNMGFVEHGASGFYTSEQKGSIAEN